MNPLKEADKPLLTQVLNDDLVSEEGKSMPIKPVLEGGKPMPLEVTLRRDSIKPVSKGGKPMPPDLALNPKRHGGGLILPGRQEIARHFSQDQTRFTKFLDFIHKQPMYKVVK